MVSLAIIVILATITFYGSFQQNPVKFVRGNAALVRSSIELARTNSEVGLKCCGGVTPKGYGVYALLNGLPDREFIVYADMDGNHKYNSSYDQIVANHGLSEGVTFSSCNNIDITIVPNATSLNSCDINFSQSQLYFNKNPSNNTVTISVQLTSDTATTASAFVYPRTLLIE